VPFRALKEPAHLALHPFGQIPTFEEDGLALFETGWESRWLSAISPRRASIGTSTRERSI